MAFIHSYGCAGRFFSDSADLWEGLASPSTQKDRFREAGDRTYATLDELLEGAYQDWSSRVHQNQPQPQPKQTWKPPAIDGIIFVSTKGEIDACVWEDSFSPYRRDTLSPVFERFLRKHSLDRVASLGISQACSGFLTGLEIANLWLKSRGKKRVLVIGVDLPGEFVSQGFAKLGALSADTTRPFAKNRSGFHLGSAAVFIDLLAHQPQKNSGRGDHPLRLSSVVTGCESSSLTYPRGRDGNSVKLIHKILEGAPLPDLVIAHGTATLANDRAEDEIFSQALPSHIPIFSTKWMTGHCLGASAGLDLLAAILMLEKNQPLFLPPDAQDPSLGGNYLRFKTEEGGEIRLKSIMTHSLGFGGVSGVALLTKSKPDLILSPAAVPRDHYPLLSELVTHRRVYFRPVLSDRNRPPAWSGKINRWSQLDETSYALADVLSKQTDFLVGFVDLTLVLACPSASNRADREFARSPSPARFVYTLPSVRASVILQILEKDVATLYCVQDGSKTWEKAEALFHDLVKESQNKQENRRLLLIELQDNPPLSSPTTADSRSSAEAHFEIRTHWA